jgi:hypothetical protein
MKSTVHIEKMVVAVLYIYIYIYIYIYRLLLLHGVWMILNTVLRLDRYFCTSKIKVKVKVKLSHYRLGLSVRVPGG